MLSPSHCKILGKPPVSTFGIFHAYNGNASELDFVTDVPLDLFLSKFCFLQNIAV